MGPSRLAAKVSLLASVVALLASCSQNELWTTPLAAPREPRNVDLAREKACRIGGNIVYGLHYEEGKYMMGTIAVASAP